MILKGDGSIVLTDRDIAMITMGLTRQLEALEKDTDGWPEALIEAYKGLHVEFMMILSACDNEAYNEIFK